MPTFKSILSLNNTKRNSRVVKNLAYFKKIEIKIVNVLFIFVIPK